MKLHRNWKERAISKQRQGRQNRLISLLSSLPSPPTPPRHPFSHSNRLSPPHRRNASGLFAFPRRSPLPPASLQPLSPFYSPPAVLPTPQPRALPWPASGAEEREKRVPSELLWVLIPPRGRGSSAASRCSSSAPVWSNSLSVAAARHYDHPFFNPLRVCRSRQPYNGLA